MGARKVDYYDKKYTEGFERLQPFKAKLVELFREDGTSGRVLDVGCGAGVISAELKRAGCQPVGIDISLPALHKYLQAGNPGLVCDLEADLPFKDNSFDSVWISEVIEHVVEYQALLAEINRVMKPGGRLYLTTPNSAFVGYRIMSLLGLAATESQHPYHVRFYSYGLLEKTLGELGFDVVRSLGQNVYAYLPGRTISVLDKTPRRVNSMLWSLFDKLGIRVVPGMIRGDKLIGYWFGKNFRRLMSNCIMIVGVKSKGLQA